MKNTVIDFLRNMPKSKSEKFNKACQLYRNSPGKNSAIERSLNASGFSERNLESVIYELKKIHGIKDVDILRAATTVFEKAADDLAEENTQSGIESNESESAPTKNEVKPLREDFPFLNEKECPDELKILVADKITAYKTYCEKHAEMQRIVSGELITVEGYEEKLAREIVEAFEENTLIYEELNHYKENGVVLGKHPIFKTLVLQREIDGKTNDELLAIIKNSDPYLSKNRKALKEETDNDKIKVIEQRIADKLQLVQLANKKLGVSGK